MSSRFSIVSSVYNEYELLRQFVESIILNVDPDTYDQVIIIDDYSYNKGKLREYENYVNKTYDKINILTQKEYRPACKYQRDLVKEKLINDAFDYRLFDNEEENLGCVSSYQKALEYVNTEFVMLLDTDCVFLSKFKNTLSQISQLYDQYPRAMSISQLHGWSSNKIFESDTIGSKKLPEEQGGLGGPSPMCSTFRMAAWTKHALMPPRVRGGHIGNGFINPFMSIIVNGFTVVNFPFYSEDYIYHIGGGTARRNVGNLPGRTTNSPYGSAADTSRYGTRREKNRTYDYFCGAHHINMDSPQFKRYLEKIYDSPFNVLLPFNESMLLKLQLNPQREVNFRPPSDAILKNMEILKGPRNDINRNDYVNMYDKYEYGTKDIKNDICYE
jgi:hypothetical protein